MRVSFALLNGVSGLYFEGDKCSSKKKQLYNIHVNGCRWERQRTLAMGTLNSDLHASTSCSEFHHMDFRQQ